MNFPLDFGRHWRRLPWAVQIAIAAIGYVAIAHLSLALALPGTNASPIWPPSGFAVALLLLCGPRQWPAIAAGALAANLIDFAAHGPLMPAHYFSAGAIAIGNTLEAAVAVWLLSRRGDARLGFQHVSGVLRFAAVCAVAGAASATVGVESLVLTDTIPTAISSAVWLTWWLGDLTGMVVLVPFAVAWTQATKPSTPSPRPWIAGLTLVGLAWVILTNPFHSVSQARPFLILLVPLFAWLTHRHGLRGGVVGVLVLASTAVLAIARGNSLLGTASTNDLFLQLDVVLIIFAFLVLLLGADLAERRESGGTPDWQAMAIAWGTLTVGCAITLFLWHISATRIDTESRQRLQQRSERIVAALHSRVLAYQDVIKGGANLLLGRPSVTREIWQDFVHALDLPHSLPGVQGIGFAEVIAPDKLEQHTARIRAEGFPGYAVHPPGPRDTYTSVVYLEPFDALNQRAFGFDMFSEPTRQAAMGLARDTGNVTATGRVKLVFEDDTNEQAGFLIYMPVYSHQRGLDTAAARQAALIGYSYAPFRVGDLVKLALANELDGLALEIYDNTEITPQNRLYPFALDAGKSDASVVDAPFQKAIDIGNRQWTVQVRGLPAYWQSVDHTASRLTLIFGMLLSVAMFLLLRMLARSRAQVQETAYFRSMIERAPSALIMVDSDGCIEMVNAPIEHMFGYSRAELLGQPVEVLIPARLRAQHVHQRQMYSNNPSQRMGLGRDLVGLCKDGSEIALEIGLSQLVNAEGHKVLCGFVDVTERKRHAAALLKSSRDLGRTNALAKVGGWEVNLQTNVITWSDETCRIHAVEPGYKPTMEEAIAFYAPEARPVIQKVVEEAVVSGEGWDLELPLNNARSERIWVRAQGEVEYENGVAVGLVGAFQDITERKNYTEELSRRNQELDKFAYIASHDLKSPLRGIDQLATWISEDLGDTVGDSAKEYLRLMRVRIHRMENLLNGLLSYARAGRVEGDSETVDTKALVSDIFDICHNHAQFELRLDGDFPAVLTTRVPLELVIRNLINNAIKHHDRPAGVITVTANAHGKHLMFEVADDGPGIPEDQVERAFDMFQTLRSRDEVEGSGIGLAIVKKTIEAFGGTIALAPNPPRGARFQFTWPIQSPPTA